jgi:hypothetical protein
MVEGNKEDPMRGIVSLFGGALLAGTLAGCAVHGTASYAAEPELVYLDDNVYVLADYPEPVFFSAGMYWRYDDSGRWYRSRVHTGNWTLVQRPPSVIARIDRPRTYVHYRPGHRARDPMTRRDDDRRMREERARERERADRQREEAREQQAREREQQAREREREREAREQAREQEKQAREQEKQAREQEKESREQAREQEKKDREEAREHDKDKKDRDDKPGKGNKKDRDRHDD